MKKQILLFTIVLGFANSILAAQMPHLDLEMTGPEYQYLLQQTAGRRAQSHALGDIVDMGARNLKWLSAINAESVVKLSFTSAATQTGIPITAPKYYNAETVRKDFNELFAVLPESMSLVLLGKKEITSQLPLPEAEYIEWGRKANKVYENAARWITMEPWLIQLAARRVNDVRGHYFLSREPNLQQNLMNFAQLSSEVKANYQEWLVQICANKVRNRLMCSQELDRANAKNQVVGFYAKYKSAGEEMWNSYFQIPEGIATNSLVWKSATPNVATAMFKDPLREDVRQYLKNNLEEEWKWNDWSMQVVFTAFRSIINGAVEVIWEAGATPHVPGLGVNQIVMDGNSPLTEYNVQWTIRHEYGHVLGLPDCYLEFYDQDAKIIVSYQHDVTDLMCSRTGHLKESHYQELKKSYLK